MIDGFEKEWQSVINTFFAIILVAVILHYVYFAYAIFIRKIKNREDEVFFNELDTVGRMSLLSFIKSLVVLGVLAIIGPFILLFLAYIMYALYFGIYVKLFL